MILFKFHYELTAEVNRTLLSKHLCIINKGKIPCLNSFKANVV